MRILREWKQGHAEMLIRIIHEGSSRKRAEAKRDGHSET